MSSNQKEVTKDLVSREGINWVGGLISTKRISWGGGLFSHRKRELRELISRREKISS